MSLAQTGPAFILAALVFLGGCRPKSDASRPTDSQPDQQQAAEDEPTPMPAHTAAPARGDDKRPLLVCFGDSLTAGYGTEAGQSYPDFLQADLDQKGYKYRVVNEGVSGATSKDGVARLPAVVALHAAVVIVEFGGNDGLRGLAVKDMHANLDRIVSTLKAAGSKVLLAGITLPPDYGPDYVTQFTATYAALGKRYQIPVYPFMLEGVFGVAGMMQADRVHATAKGNEVVARRLLPVVEPLLKK